MKAITVVIINHRTPGLLRRAVVSFRKYYEDMPLMLIDNGSKDDSVGVLKQLQAQWPTSTRLLLMRENRYHGPAMHRALKTVDSELVFFLDSDTLTLEGGFLEAMARELRGEQYYGAGIVKCINRRGFIEKRGLEVLATPYMMLKKAVYENLPPFIHHGYPGIHNFRKAKDEGYKLVDFPVENYIRHDGRGTAGRYGYGLGIKGKINYLLQKMGL